jgi:hypothetical protein
LPSHKCKTAALLLAAPCALRISGFAFALTLALLLPLPSQQLAVDLRDSFQVIFDLVVVFDPLADLFHFLVGNDSTGRAPAPQRYRQIPQWAVPLAFGAPAGRMAAGHVAFYQRSAQDLGDRRKLISQALPALA